MSNLLASAQLPRDVIVNAQPAAGMKNDFGEGALEQAKVKKFFFGDGKDNNVAHVRKRETALIRFLGRAVRMSFYLTICLCGVVAATVSMVVLANRYDGSDAVRAAAVAVAVRQAFFARALYQVLWFFNLKYRKPVFHTTDQFFSRTPGQSRDGSRMPSRAGSFSDLASPGGSLRPASPPDLAQVEVLITRRALSDARYGPGYVAAASAQSPEASANSSASNSPAGVSSAGGGAGGGANNKGAREPPLVQDRQSSELYSDGGEVVLVNEGDHVV
jgi:hypothetical protein